ncbi:MAG: HlyD family secretion protein, partial [Xanthobacteraceae bacterium]
RKATEHIFVCVFPRSYVRQSINLLWHKGVLVTPFGNRDDERLAIKSAEAHVLRLVTAAWQSGNPYKAKNSDAGRKLDPCMIEELGRSGIASHVVIAALNRTLAGLTDDAPAVKQAEAKVEAAKRDLVQAELNLRYCDVVADIDGVVTRRNVNPGNNVQVGQSLMAIRSLDEIWVDANFKETQLRDLRIGQPVDLYVDMYGGRHVFKGRVSGFTEGTGSTLSLLPAENATGNFIKVVQRLPVRVDIEGYDPDKNPLFIGTSVVPYVYVNKPPSGPDAGKFLQGYEPQPQNLDSLHQSALGAQK